MECQVSIIVEIQLKHLNQRKEVVLDEIENLESIVRKHKEELIRINLRTKSLEQFVVNDA